MLRIEKKDGKKDGDPMNRLDKQLLKEMIRQMLYEADEAGVSTKFQTGVMSTSQRMKQSRERIKAAGSELESTEQKIIDQLEAKLTQLASLPGVDMVKHRGLLIRVMKLLNNTMAPKNQNMEKK
jgi:hypothetical protein